MCKINCVIILLFVMFVSCQTSIEPILKCVKKNCSTSFVGHIRNYERYLIQKQFQETSTLVGLQEFISRLKDDEFKNEVIRSLKEYNNELPMLSDQMMLENCCRNHVSEDEICDVLISMSQTEVSIDKLGNLVYLLGKNRSVKDEIFLRGTIQMYLYYLLTSRKN